MTSCGYGDIHPTGSSERVASVIAMLMSSLIFGFIIGDVGRIVRNFNLLAAEYREKMNYIDKFLREKNVPN